MSNAANYLENLGRSPGRILMIKGHSAGIGDILRSSAAWRSLKNAFPKAELHLVLFTWEPSYASSALVARHHLLRGCEIMDKEMCLFRNWPRLSAWAEKTASTIKPDLILDFEPAGIYSAFATGRLGRASGATTVGIGDFPLRGAFYDIVSVSKIEYARARNLEYPLEYTNRDFVCLSALGIERNGTPIELEETDEALAFRENLRPKFGLPPASKIIGLNIGCGTPDAKGKRPKLPLLRALVEHVRKTHDAIVILAGAPFEQDINHEFIALWPDDQKKFIFDLAGKTSLLELSGLIRACDLFISTDSGPYHMSVGLGVPTLAVFRAVNRVHVHHEKNVRCMALEKEEHLEPAIKAAAELLPNHNLET